jgi:HNH endonuclease
MKQCVYNTDPEWVSSLRGSGAKSNINFWRRDKRTLHLEPGTKFYFKLRVSRDIVGRGEFRNMRLSTISKAWLEFGKGNGVESEEDFRIRAHEVLKIPKNDETINCIILDNVELLEGPDFPKISDVLWPRQIVGQKFFQESELAEFDKHFAQGSISEKLQSKIGVLHSHLKDEGAFDPSNLEDARDIVLRAIIQRRGQHGFREKLLAAYEKQCAISQSSTVEVLEAAHIVPYLGPETNKLQNGILLRSDLHTLFDLGLLSVSKTYEVTVHPSLTKSDYNEYSGKKIHLPKDPGDWPSAAALEQHDQQINNSP